MSAQREALHKLQQNAEWDSDNEQTGKNRKNVKIDNQSKKKVLMKNGPTKKPVKAPVLEEPEDAEGMSRPPAEAKSRPHMPWARKQPRQTGRPASSRPVSKPESRPKPSVVGRQSAINQKSAQSRVAEKTKKKSGYKEENSSDETPPNKVKQFSFPQYKILSGASVAPLKMIPRTIMIQNSEERDEPPRHWAEGLFQPTKMSLRLRLLRLLLIWVFFRVLNKQTYWLSEALGIGEEDIPDDPRKQPPNPKPGERYIKVFHDSSPYPFHVRVPPTAAGSDSARPGQ